MAHKLWSKLTSISIHKASSNVSRSDLVSSLPAQHSFLREIFLALSCNTLCLLISLFSPSMNYYHLFFLLVSEFLPNLPLNFPFFFLPIKIYILAN